jgi:hypothetical protein
MFALLSSPGDVADGWDGIVRRGCNFIELMPRLREK